MARIRIVKIKKRTKKPTIKIIDISKPLKKMLRTNKKLLIELSK